MQPGFCNHKAAPGAVRPAAPLTLADGARSFAATFTAMIAIGIRKVTKRFGPTVALQGLDLTIQPGELFCLLGPSGCGKTTLLRCLAGFCIPDEGTIHFDDDDVTRLPPHRRQAGMVFQSYALWPHLTVAENVAFGLEERGQAPAEVRPQVERMLAAVQLDGLGARRPDELSGGQQQRVALARALVVRPRCLLLDEPLASLDARLRQELRAEIRRVCREHRLTTVYVTHDQQEALAVADRLAVMDGGRILQTGTPREVYTRPACRAVAGFLGATNLLPGRIVGGEGPQLVVDTAVCRFTGVPGDPAGLYRRGDDVTVSIRPEGWRLAAAAPARNGVRGRLEETVFLGEQARHRLRCGDQVLVVAEFHPAAAPPARGELWAAAEPGDVVVLAR